MGRKIAYGEFEPPHLFDHVKKTHRCGKYDRHIIEDYSREEFDELNTYIDHSRDMTFSYAAVKQLEGKYLVQNRVTRQIYETPQFFIYFGGDVPLQQIPERDPFGLRQTLLRRRFHIQSIAADPDYERRAHAYAPVLKLRID